MVENRLNFIAMIRAIHISVFMTLLFTAQLSAQENIPVSEKSPAYNFHDHLVYAGNMGLNFGNVTSISFSPMIGYKVTPKFIPGIGVTYNYLRFNYSNYPSESIHIYGGSIWARYYMFENVFAHGEYEVLNGEWDPYYKPGIRYNLNSILLGGGYQESFGGLSSYVLVLYNVTYGPDSPYASPVVIRVGMGFGM